MALTGKTRDAESLARDMVLPAARNASVKDGGLYAARFFNYLQCALADGTLLFGIVLAATWLLSRPFGGIEADARIYMARALADLDPAGVGRDFMFVYDGQSQFSIFSILADRLVAAFDPAGASLVFAWVNLICWFAAAQFFASRFAEGRMKWAILMILAVVPSYYGPYQILQFREQFAVPRPLAEACVLVALAFLTKQRRGLAFIFLTAAAALHPIMALPGVLIFALDLCRSDRRWIAAGFGLVIAGLIAALSGLPFFDRLTTLIDPDWLALLRVRNPYLFPTLWDLQPFAFLALQIVTIALAADLLTPRVRTMAWAVAGAGIGGILISLIFGDLWPVLLVVQAQLWRMTWLTGVVAAICLGLCLLHLPRRDIRCQAATAFLVLGWVFYDEPVFGIPAMAVALLLSALRHVAFPVRPSVLKILWALIVAAGLEVRLPSVLAFFHYVADKPQGYHASYGLLWNIYFPSIPLVAFAVAWVLRPAWFSVRVMGSGAAAVMLAAMLLWDDRSADRKLTDEAHHPAGLVALFPADHSEIYWMRGVEPWYLLGHPSWLLPIQGAGIVFSRPLAMFWEERLRALLSLNLADQNILGPWTMPEPDIAIQLTRNSVDHLCARADAPGSIVAPLEEGTPRPADLKFKTWEPPVPEFRLSQKGETVSWHKFAEYLIVSCADHAL